MQVYITLKGTRGKTGRRRLQKNPIASLRRASISSESASESGSDEEGGSAEEESPAHAGRRSSSSAASAAGRPRSGSLGTRPSASRTGSGAAGAARRLRRKPSTMFLFSPGVRYVFDVSANDLGELRSCVLEVCTRLVCLEGRAPAPALHLLLFLMLYL